MSTEEKTWFSATELSLLGDSSVAGLPKTMQGVKWRAKKGSWESREVRGGGGPGGILTEYQPPAPVLALIQAFLEANPGFFKSGKTRSKTDLVRITNEMLGELPPDTPALIRVAAPAASIDVPLIRRLIEEMDRVASLPGSKIPAKDKDEIIARSYADIVEAFSSHESRLDAARVAGGFFERIAGLYRRE